MWLGRTSRYVVVLEAHLAVYLWGRVDNYSCDVQFETACVHLPRYAGAMLVPDSPTGLYWSLSGHVACAVHAVEIMDFFRWNIEGWAPIPRSSQGFEGVSYQCEYCSPEQTSIVPRPDSPNAP